MPWVGVDSYRRWAVEVVPTWLTTPKLMVPAYQTVAGFLGHLFRYDQRWNPAPIVNVPFIAYRRTKANLRCRRRAAGAPCGRGMLLLTL